MVLRLRLQHLSRRQRRFVARGHNAIVRLLTKGPPHYTRDEWVQGIQIVEEHEGALSEPERAGF